MEDKKTTEFRESLRLTFDAFADLYDQMRPEYPEQLIDDVIAVSGTPVKGRILEIGCGTGIATRQFALRGYRMIGLDIGSDLAAVAARSLELNEDVTIDVTSFEDWNPGEHRFDLVLAATSFHWIDPEIRYFKIAEVLKKSGALAVFWNNHVGFEGEFVKSVRPLYRKHAPSYRNSSLEADREKQNEIGEFLFNDPIQKSYSWSVKYSSEGYIKLLNTYSTHISLPDTERARLFTEIRQLINNQFQGHILKNYETVLELRTLKT